MMDQARERLGDAHAAASSGGTVSAAYYAMLYAARAALSERDLNARTHRGVWDLFHQTFVLSGLFPAELYAAASHRQELREAADYGASPPRREVADEVLADAERFVAAVKRMFAGEADPGSSGA